MLFTWDQVPKRLPPPVEALLTMQLNELITLPDRLVLILDDYYLIEAAPVNHTLTFLLDHLPPQLYLVMTLRVGAKCHRPGCGPNARLPACT